MTNFAKPLRITTMAGVAIALFGIGGCCKDIVYAWDIPETTVPSIRSSSARRHIASTTTADLESSIATVAPGSSTVTKSLLRRIACKSAPMTNTTENQCWIFTTSMKW